MAIGKAASTGLKRGRKSKRGRPKKKVDEAVEKKINKKRKEKVKRTAKENAELKKLIKSQMRDDKAVLDTGPKRRKVKGVAEGPNRPALSKVKSPKKMSPAERRRRVSQGIVGGPRPQRRPDSRTNIRDVGEFTETQDIIAERMGLGGGIIDEDEIMTLGGFEIRKGGGQIKYKKKGGPIGVGAARTGFGKVRG